MSAVPTFLQAAPPSAPRRVARGMVAVLYRQTGLIAAGALMGAAVPALLSLDEPRLYTSTAQVRIATGAQHLAGHAPSSHDAADRGIAAEAALLRTRAIAQAVVERYAIDDSQLARRGWPRPRLAHGAASPGERRSRTVDLFLAGLTVRPLPSRTGDPSSDVLEVTFACSDPALAPKALQAVLDNVEQLEARRAEGLAEARLAQARDDLQHADDRIVALLAQDPPGAGRAVAAGAGGLRLDLDPGTAVGSAGVVPATSVRPAPALQPALRLDDGQPARDLRGQPDAAPFPGARTVREDTPQEAALNGLERARQRAQERYVDLSRRPEAGQADRRVAVVAPVQPVAAEGAKGAGIAWPGPMVGLLLGLLLAALRERGGDRLRSAREAQRALGVPVLGAIPTLSAKARNTYFEPSAKAPGASPAQLA